MTGTEKPDKNGSRNTGAGGNQPLTDVELGARTRALDEALSSRRKSSDRGKKEQTSSTAGYSQALRLSSEFIAGIVVGAFIGWLIDELAGTSPWGLIVFFFLGFCAGVLNVMRSAGMVAENEMTVRKTDRSNNGGETR